LASGGDYLGMTDFEIPTSPMVARAMKRFYELMEKQEPGRWGAYLEFYAALVEALSAKSVATTLPEPEDTFS
jgi:hypothetical protein